jgi:hypothetical protein
MIVEFITVIVSLPELSAGRPPHFNNLLCKTDFKALILKQELPQQQPPSVYHFFWILTVFMAIGYSMASLFLFL